MKDITVGYAFCGSFCTIKNSLEALKRLVSMGYRVKPIMSEIVYNTDTRFFKADELKKQVAEICDCSIIHDIVSAEPIGPKNLLDIIVVAPCTGNTIAKCALGITDTPVTMSVKAHLRNNKPVVLAIATNDALGASAKNIGLLHNTNNIYFVPYRQDDATGKNNSLVCDFSLIPETVESALKREQIQPVII
ncbi:MAG: dipicolinate synthase subunit B [Clostridia bacterium]|nr:dipicolinate synthase subunit B [Clostridia bacterium]MBQ2237212.1 dipicolinate synthase subunit B [Clostridia bacterium]MEE1185608.1 dipicolinate synthase subunit B [Acutalibacteraceae bacterium]